MIETKKFTSSIIFAELNRLKISSLTSTIRTPDSIMLDEVRSEKLATQSWWRIFDVGDRFFVSNVRPTFVQRSSNVRPTFDPVKKNILIFMEIICLSFKALDLAILIKVSFQTKKIISYDS